MVTPGTSAIAERPAPGSHQELKGRNIMTSHASRNTSNSRNASNNRTANTEWTLSKAGILAKTVKPATAWREATAAETIGTSQRQQQKGDPQQQGCLK
jgi:hypothetical protein